MDSVTLQKEKKNDKKERYENAKTREAYLCLLKHASTTSNFNIHWTNRPCSDKQFCP